MPLTVLAKTIVSHHMTGRTNGDAIFGKREITLAKAVSLCSRIVIDKSGDIKMM
ncbi:hypothetical protein [Thermosinus carboxydivorans]|uniref:hypothetical protein n=1 Tax=Thermosinus carboxydivorans TaxID=261685 RepID=UPI00031EB359|nr:hypothetical protein [Thermosinus carboxydivorans]